MVCVQTGPKFEELKGCLLAIDRSLLKNLKTLPENSGLALFLLLTDTERRISVSMGCVESARKK